MKLSTVNSITSPDFASKMDEIWFGLFCKSAKKKDLPMRQAWQFGSVDASSDTEIHPLNLYCQGNSGKKKSGGR